MSYRRVVSQATNIQFLAYPSLFMDSWRQSLLIDASEEQLHGLGSIPERRIRCRRGYPVKENSYHVATACPVPAYTTKMWYTTY